MNFKPYPFEKLSLLLDNISPNEDYSFLNLGIGEPQFETPKFIIEEINNHSNLFNKYPKTAGEPFLKESMLEYLKNRFNLKLEKEELIPTFGTREVLFNFPQFLLHNKKESLMLFPNPFYQIYEGAGVASYSKVIYLKYKNNKLIIPKEEVLKEANLVILNSPNNPTSNTLSLEELKEWATLSLKYDFVLLNDECYIDIYLDNPIPSLLNASYEIGNRDFKNILVINSLSKRSSAPGIRSGFIAGDKTILKDYLKYRTYVGSASPLPLQYGASIAWRDENHVKEFREKYKKNFQIAKEILEINPPKASFYIWLKVDNALEFTKKLYEKKNVKVLPGEFLGREDEGKEFIRIALVYEEEKTKEALNRIKELLWNK